MHPPEKHALHKWDCGTNFGCLVFVYLGPHGHHCSRNSINHHLHHHRRHDGTQPVLLCQQNNASGCDLISHGDVRELPRVQPPAAGQGAGQPRSRGGSSRAVLGWGSPTAAAGEVMTHRMLLWVQPPFLLNVGIHSHRE